MSKEIVVVESDQSCGAAVFGLDLGKALNCEQVSELRSLWLQHHVLSFPEQTLTDDNLERFSQYFGDFGDDPFIQPVPDREHVIAVERRADETSSIFAEAFHTDWSFQPTPPAGTCLYGITIPTSGGDTLFANQHQALTEMPNELRKRIEGKQGIHSAKLAYAPDGAYGEMDSTTGRSMRIVASEEANNTQLHPLIRAHPETGREGLFGCLGYIIGIEGMGDEAFALLSELHQWQTQEQFIYRHEWQPNMLVMWDNRSVLHAATGGYEGQARLLHRTTIGAQRKL
ncbi:MAG: TauD/TfdA dioxygenase family protein [Gammaproteobacteria bacterium]